MSQEQILRNDKLTQLHSWLTLNVEGYTAMSEAGSTTAGDPWVEGRSDRDISIVVELKTPTITEDIQRALARLAFNDNYLFLVLDKERYLRTENEQDLSVKFRGEILFGEDVLTLKEKPTLQFASTIAQRGLSSMVQKLETRQLNSAYWSEDHLKDKTYSEFKRFIMFLAAERYGATGLYPRMRIEVAKAYDSEQLHKICSLLARFESATHEEVDAGLVSALDFIRSRN